MPTEEIVLHASLRDEISGPISHVRREIAATAREAEASNKHLTAASGGLTRMEVAGTQLRKSMSGLNTNLKDTSEWLGTHLVSAAKKGGIAFGVLTAAVGVFGLKAASQFQTSQLAFETLLGSAEKGKTLFKELQTLNLKTPFQLGDLTSSTQVLLRYGVAGDQILPIIKSLSDIAATSDNPTENLNRLALAIGQVTSQGRLLGQDARQLAEAGFNPYAVLASKLGKTQDEIRKLGEAGKLSSKDLIDALIAESNGLERFRGGAERMNQTLMGQMSNLWDALKVGMAGAAQPITAELTRQMPMIVGLLSGIVSQIGPPIFALIGGLGDTLLKLLPAVVPIVTALAGGFLTLLNAAGPAISALQPLGGTIGIALTGFFTALAPIMPDIVQLFAALVLVLPDFIQLLTDLLPLLDMLVRFASGLLGFEPVRKIMAGLLVVLLGYRALASIAGGLYAFSGGLLGVARAQEQVNVAMAGGGGGGFMSGGKLAGAGMIAGGGLGVAAGASGATGGQSAAGDAMFVGSAALLGAGLGSVLPGPGTAAGAIAGGVLGGGYVLSRRLMEFFGDVPSSTVNANLSRNLALASAAGGGRITSTVRNFAIRGSDSGHLDGRAIDIVPPNPSAFVSRFNSLGGSATAHGGHVHAEIGDVPMTSRAGDGGVHHHFNNYGQVYGVDDLEARWNDWYRQTRKQDRERARDG